MNEGRITGRMGKKEYNKSVSKLNSHSQSCFDHDVVDIMICVCCGDEDKCWISKGWESSYLGVVEYKFHLYCDSVS